MKRFVSIPIIMLSLLMWFVSCNDSSFKGASAKQKVRPSPAESPASGKATEAGSGGSGAPVSEPAVGATPTPTGGGGITDDGGNNGGGITDDGDNCPQEAQSILVVDLKSGWWSGDGGEIFKAILGKLVNPKCTKAGIDVEYHHVVAGSPVLDFATCGETNLPALDPGISCAVDAATSRCLCSKADTFVDTRIVYPAKETTNSEATFGPSAFNDFLKPYGKTLFLQDDFSKYTQIWLLSGSVADSVDLPIAHAFFVELISRISKSSSPLFIGAGYGSISHANALTKALALGSMFTTIKDGSQIVFLQEMNGKKNTISISTKIAIPEAAKSNSLFMGVAEIADTMIYHQVIDEVGDAVAVKDIVIEGDSLAGGTILIQDTGTPVRNSIGTALIGKRKIVLDAGMQRFYAISLAHAGTSTYLQNIAYYLGQTE